MHIQEKTIMQVSEDLSTRKSSVRTPEFAETVLLAIILVAFLLLHILAGTIVQGAGKGDDASSQPDVRSRLYD